MVVSLGIDYGFQARPNLPSMQIGVGDAGFAKSGASMVRGAPQVRPGGICRGGGERQEQAHQGTISGGGAADFEGAAVEFCDAPDDGKPELAARGRTKVGAGATVKALLHALAPVGGKARRFS
jgi:hypothetical protein